MWLILVPYTAVNSWSMPWCNISLQWRRWAQLGHCYYCHVGSNCLLLPFAVRSVQRSKQLQSLYRQISSSCLLLLVGIPAAVLLLRCTDSYAIRFPACCCDCCNSPHCCEVRLLWGAKASILFHGRMISFFSWIVE